MIPIGCGGSDTNEEPGAQPVSGAMKNDRSVQLAAQPQPVSRARALARDDEAADGLHSYPFKETGLVGEVFSRTCGRLGLVARGGRRPQSAMRGLLMAFQ